jgi:membrane protein
MSGFVPGINFVWQAANFLISFAVITVLFALIFKVMPDIEITWHDVWVGAVMTALLFNVGKFLLGLYLARSSVASAYGAAGSIVIILLWVFYSSQVLFFGAEFTQVYARSCGSHCASAGSSALASQSPPITTTLPTREQRPVPQARPAPNAFRPRKQDLGVALLFIAACFGSTKLFKHHSKRIE